MKKIFRLFFVFSLVLVFASCSGNIVNPDPEPNCVIGEEGPSGGFIFFCDDLDNKLLDVGEVGLEAAPADLEGSHYWSNIFNSEEIGAEAQGTAIGTGAANTDAIIAQEGHETSAAKSCKDYFPEGHANTAGDWFLPSEDELNEMRENLYQKGVGGFNTEITSGWWSSSEAVVESYLYAMSQYFFRGNKNVQMKATEHYVRCVRAF